MTFENLNNFSIRTANEESLASSLQDLTSNKPPAEIDWEAQLEDLFDEFQDRAREIIEKCGPIQHLENPIGTGGMNGFAHSGNIAHWRNIEFNYFYHRSESEVAIHKALLKINYEISKEKGSEHSFVFSPLSVFVGLKRKRVETDFLVITHDGVFIIEVDGDSHREKSHFEEEERLRPFRNLGVDVYRIKPDLSNPEWAEKAVRDFLKFASVRGRRV